MSERDLVSAGRIDPSRLDRDHYAESLAREALRVGILTESDLDRIRLSLLKVLSEVIGYMTEGESTNVGIDTAKELAESVLYNVGTVLRTKNTPDEAALLLREGSMSGLYAEGYQINRTSREEAVRLLARVRYSRLSDGGAAYDKAIDVILRRYLEAYDPRTCAHSKLFLFLPKYRIRGPFHIRGAVAVLKRLLEINSKGNGAGKTAAEFSVTETDINS